MNTLTQREPTREVARADPNDYISFGTFCKGLPHVKPRRTMWQLDNWFFNAVRADTDDPVEVAPGVHLTSKELGELHYDNDWGSRVISPAGGALLIRLYREGLLDTGGRSPEVPRLSATAFVESERELREKAAARHEEARRYRERLRQLDSFSEAEFTYTLLNDIFIAVNGLGEGELVIGGVTVYKSLCGFSSNSGKSRDFSVEYCWTASDGTCQTVSKTSCFAGNRRNDEGRNWGLPE